MKTIQLLGAIAQEAISVTGHNGLPREVQLAAEAGQAVLAVATADEAAADRVKALVGHLEGRGSAKDALAVLFPELPSTGLAITLAVANWATESMRDNGRIDPDELLELLPRLAREIR